MPPPGWGTPQAPANATGPRDKDKLSDIQKAALRGFSVVMLISELEQVWSSLQEVSKAGDIRCIVYKAMDDSREDLNIEKGDLTNFHLEDQTVKDIKDCNFAPGGSSVIMDWIMRGTCILHFMNMSSRAKMASEADDALWDATARNRTEEQVTKRLKTEARTPPEKMA